MEKQNLTLHEAMLFVLSEQPEQTASTKVISDEVARRELYRQKGGGIAHSGQIRIRAIKYPKLFEVVDRDTVRLIAPPKRIEGCATLEDAIALAVEAHKGQKDKGDDPYILHPLRVMFTCKSEVERIVAVLHDVVEDTDVSFDDLRRLGFSEEVLTALECVTKREGEAYEQFVERAAGNPIARVVKLADLQDNMDLRRLDAVEPKDIERFQKYVKAWRRLNASGV